MPLSILANASVAAVGRVVNVFFGIAITALITRTLGPTRYGTYVALLAFGSLVQLVADFGLYLTLTRDISQKPERRADLVSLTISLRVLLLLVMFVISLALLPFFPLLRGWQSVFVIIAIGLGYQSISQLLMGVYQQSGEVWKATIGDMVGRFVQVFALFFMGLKFSSVKGAAALFLLGSGVALVIHQLLLPANALWKPRINTKVWKGIIKASWPLGLMLILNAVYFRIDTLILSMFWPSDEVGRYGVAYRVIESALFFPAMLGGLLLPKLSEAISKSDLARARRYIDEAFRLLLVASVLVVIVLFKFNSLVIAIIAGREFVQSGSLLAVLGIALGVMFIGNLFGFALVALKKQASLLKLYLALVVFNIVINFLAIPFGGAMAAAWTTVATEIISTGVAAFLVGKAIHYHPSFNLWLKLGVISVVVLGGLLLVKQVGLWWQLLIVLIMYAGLIFGGRVITRQNIELLRSA